jgi:hypothetical protein
MAIVAHDMPSLMAGKLHAILARPYTKGRDWYDFLWYAARTTKPSFALLGSSLHQTGPWAGKTLVVDEAWCHRELSRKIKSLDFLKIREDVRRLLRPVEEASLGLWTQEFFLERATKLFAPSGEDSIQANA